MYNTCASYVYTSMLHIITIAHTALNDYIQTVPIYSVMVTIIIMEDGDNSYTQIPCKVTTFTFADFLSIIIIIDAKLLLWVHIYNSTCIGMHVCMKLSFHVLVSYLILNLMPQTGFKTNKQNSIQPAAQQL